MNITSSGPHLKFVLCCVFIDMLGVGIVAPVLPLIVGDFVDPINQAMWFGLLTVVFGLMQFVFLPLLGALSDKYGRRPILLFSMAGMSLSFLLAAVSQSLFWLFAGRIVGGLCGATMAVAFAYASDISTSENRAQTFGKIGAAFGLGFICGPALGGILGAIEVRYPFYVAAFLSLGNFVFGYFTMVESVTVRSTRLLTFRALNPITSIVQLFKRKEIRALAAIHALMAFAQILQQTTWVLFTTSRFQWGPVENGISLLCFGLVAAIVQAGLLSKMVGMFGERKLVVFGLMSGCITFILFGLVVHGWMMYLLIMCNFFAFAAGPALQGLLSKMTAPSAQGELMGSLQSVSSLAIVVMPLIGSALLTYTNTLPPKDLMVGATFFWCATLFAFAIVIAVKKFGGVRSITELASDAQL